MCFFRLFAAPPVYAPKSFSPPFGSVHVWSAADVDFWGSVVLWYPQNVSVVGRRVIINVKHDLHAHRNCTIYAEI